MVEKLTGSPELSREKLEALSETGVERSTELKNERERNVAERGPEQDVDTLKENAERAAEIEKKKAENETTPVEKRRDTPAQRRAKQKASFNLTMKEAQSHMSPANRTFSKVIHNKTVEKTSEFIGSTVARPNAILAGAVTAFVFSLALYLIANHNGYPLSGSETIATFALGWVVGILFDYIRIMVTGKKS